MSEDNKNIVITSAVRTPIGAFRGSLKDMLASDLGALTTKAAMEKSNLNSNDVDELIMGQVLTGATGQNPARQAAIQAGIPFEKNSICNKSSLWIGPKINRCWISSNHVQRFKSNNCGRARKYDECTPCNSFS